MRFQKHQSPPPYLNRRDQARMLGLCVLLALVLLAIEVARKPDSWNWMFASGGVPQVGTRGKHEDVDFRIAEGAERPLAPDEFVAAADAEPQSQSASSRVADESEFEVFQSPLLENVQDKRLGFLRSEQPALEALAEHVRNVPWNELQATAAEDAGHRVVHADPEHYRGRLLTIDGTLRRYQPFTQADEAAGHGNLFLGWVFTEEAGNNPWCILCTETTPQLPFAERMNVHVRVSGYFLKLYGYPTQTGIHLAPLLIAKRYEVLPEAGGGTLPTEGLTKYVVLLVLLIGGGIALILWHFYASDRRYAASRRAKIAADLNVPTAEELESLKGLTPIDLYQVPLEDADKSS